MWLSFGSYERKARLAPAFILALPIGMTTFAWFHGESLGLQTLKSVGLSGALLAALAVLFAAVARVMGKSRERGLWESWGGNPAVDLLRHRNSNLSSVTRQSYLECAATILLASSTPPPTADQEGRDPATADAYYQALVDKLIESTRDRQRFPLIFEENRNYGFSRNLWGMKTLGILFSALSVAGCSALLYIEWDMTKSISALSFVVFIFDLGMLSIWIFAVTRESVKVPAVAYARVLLASCAELCKQSAPIEK